MRSRYLPFFIYNHDPQCSSQFQANRVSVPETNHQILHLKASKKKLLTLEQSHIALDAKTQYTLAVTQHQDDNEYDEGPED